MTKRLLFCIQAFLFGLSTAMIFGCRGDSDSENSDPSATDASQRATFQRIGDLIELPIGDIVVVAHRSLPDTRTNLAISNAREPRLTRVSLALMLPDLVPRDLERRNRDYVFLTFNQVPRDAYPPTVAEEFARRTAGYRGPIRFNEEISYFEHPANIDRYYVFADPDFRRPDGSKPWLFCYRRIHEETLTLCGGRGAWVTDSVRWGYRFTSGGRISDWPHIDERLAALVPTFIKQ